TGVQTCALPISLGPLTQDNEAVGHREDGMVLGFRSWKLPEEEGRRLAGREVKRQPLDEVLDFRRHLPVVDSQHRAERVDHDPSRADGFDLTHDTLEDGRQAELDLSAQRAEADHAVHLGWIEETVLLLVPEQLERWLTDDRAVDATTLSPHGGE